MSFLDWQNITEHRGKWPPVLYMLLGFSLSTMIIDYEPKYLLSELRGKSQDVTIIILFMRKEKPVSKL